MADLLLLFVSVQVFSDSSTRFFGALPVFAILSFCLTLISCSLGFLRHLHSRHHTVSATVSVFSSPSPSAVAFLWSRLLFCLRRQQDFPIPSLLSLLPALLWSFDVIPPSDCFFRFRVSPSVLPCRHLDAAVVYVHLKFGAALAHVPLRLSPKCWLLHSAP